MRSIIIPMLIIFFPCFSADNNYECISLGEACAVGAALEAFELRNAAYPFDWIVSLYQPFCTALEEDFKDWLNPAYLSVRDDNRGIINKYGLVFVHDFPTVNYSGDLETENLIVENQLSQNWIDFLPEVEKKYDRRIQRFRDACSSHKKIYFIRHAGASSRHEAYTIRNILKNRYPKLDFTLVMVAHDESFAEPWQEENIRNYHLKMTAVWNDVAEWKKIFVDLGLDIPLNRTTLQERMDEYCQKYVTYGE